MGRLINDKSNDIIFTSHNGNLTIFSSELKTFIANNILERVKNFSGDVKRDEDALQKQLEGLNKECTELEEQISVLQEDYDKKSNKIGHFHKENVLNFNLTQNFDEGVMDLAINSQFEVESLVLISDFDFEVVIDEQLFIY